MTVLDRYAKYSRRRRRRAARAHQRLDIQGLRMVAVLTVFANHLWGWPHGGFIGVDVFFVISGFLITGNLMRAAETHGTVSFRTFYWNRVRRIVPAATVVLVLTYLAAVLVFLPFRAQKVGIDAFWAFFFLSNWRFAAEDTDYFAAAANTVSPIQHYWSLSIEEQFYLVWPALIFLISLLVVRKAWTHHRRMMLAGGVTGVIVAASLGWAMYESVAAPTWAYFNTFARVWELGVGALLATTVGALARIPDRLRPYLSWAGLALIAASVVLISENSGGFPAPWALLPVAGSALVIAAGVGREPAYQEFLRNPVSTYIGDISYSLYLVHWPVIVILGSVMDSGTYFAIAAAALAFALAVASYHFVENPLRRADWTNFTGWTARARKLQLQPQKATGYAALAVVALLTLSLSVFTMRPEANQADIPPALAVVDADEVDPSAPEPTFGPLTAALQEEIVAALKATEWPALDPSMESVINDPQTAAVEVLRCGRPEILPDADCTWGPADAPTKVVIVGSSIAMSYSGPLRELALNGGQIQLHTESLFGCDFVQDQVISEGIDAIIGACPVRKQHAIDYINANKPDVVIIANGYSPKTIFGAEDQLSPAEWSDSLQQFVERFQPSAGQVVLLSPPPGEVSVADCYGKRSSDPTDCVSPVGQHWGPLADAEQQLADSIGLTWMDSRPWFCSGNRLCPSFAGTTPTKSDRAHITAEYGIKIAPVMNEAFHDEGIF